MPGPADRSPSGLPGFRDLASRRRAVIAELAGVRRAHRLTQLEVAGRMGTAQSVVARLEAGEIDARFSTLQRYAAALHCRLDVQLTSVEEDG